MLYRNNGNGTFTDVTKEAGLLNPQVALSAPGALSSITIATARLDLFVANYLTFESGHGAAGRQAERVAIPGGVFCGPRGLPYGYHSLYHNNGDGHILAMSPCRPASDKAEGGYGLTVVAADFDNDGWPDIYVACDSTPSLLFRNKHDGTFREEGLERGVALSEDGMEQAGMGIGIGDLGLDGNLDIIKTHFAADTPALYMNDGKGDFLDRTLRAGLGVETRFVGWGVGVADLDNDGNPDIFWVTGGIYPEEQDHYATPRLFHRAQGPAVSISVGTPTEIAGVGTRPERSREA